MTKYYTRACNFYYGSLSIKKVEDGLSYPLNNHKNTVWRAENIDGNILLNDLTDLPSLAAGVRFSFWYTVLKHSEVRKL